jgi:hypothetical protein
MKKNFIDIVNDSPVVDYYRDNQEGIHSNLGLAIYSTLSRIDYFSDKPKDVRDEYYKLNHNDTSPNRKFNRLSIGYNALGKYGFTPARCGLYSKGVLDLPGKKTGLVMKEHTMGVSMVGNIVFIKISTLYDAGESKEWIIDYMNNMWLKDNLHLWAQVQVLKTEDKKLIKDGHTYDEKINLVHYDEAGIVL